MEYLFRFVGNAVLAYLSVCTGIWVYLCVQHQQIFSDITVRQFLSGWWHWLT